METKIAFPQMLNKYRLLKNLTMEQLAEEVGKTKSTISKWEAGTRSPKIYEIEEIAKYFGIEPQTMMFGDTSKMQLIYDRLEPTRQENVITYAEKQLNEQENKIISTFDDRKRVPAYVEGVVAAGLGSYQEENLHMEVHLLESEIPDKYDTIAQVVGDSMEPLIKNDDLLFIEVTSQVDINSIGIFQVNGKNFVKKLKRDYDGDWYLQSLNNNYEEIYLSEHDDIRTIGEVVSVYRED
ncbi:helix-turn-helix domain-containing protein [Streptococcus agalactiae]|uniref:helix-turn-helix domain-containing protein n=1 Tax=Streptococcus agalactiae TaxID=1311 RepID=UPI0009A952FD|nr:XRE family transcriptional regulator [Streptococcus agalactiae]